jgi:signal transduction histidine kinase
VLPSQLNDDFLLTLVHDVRAYVRKSLAGMQIIERSIGSDLEAGVRERFDQVIGANRDLDKFLARISDYAGAASPGKGKPVPLLAALQTAASQFPGKAIQLLPMPEGGTRITVRPEMVRSFAELMDNALKFSSHQPVSVGFEMLSGDSIAVKIRDRGVGVPDEHRERVFDLFIRLHSKDEYPGFGLGLPICRRLADVAGADVKLRRHPDGGTMAMVTIPNTHSSNESTR